MVRANSLTPDAISKAMYHEDFYATNGIILSQLDSDTKKIVLQVDMEATESELQSTYVTGHQVDLWTPGYLIQFIGKDGKVLKQVPSTRASNSITNENGYVRAKVTFTRIHVDGFENFYAWTQPVFTDGRKHYELKFAL